MWRLRLWWLFLAVSSGYSNEVANDALLLARARAHNSYRLAKLPNYTCLQTVERTVKAPGRRLELVDVVRLEVALVDGRELFAWPGSRKFEDTRIIDMVKGGAIGNGNFALHAKAVLQTRGPRFTFAGERVRADGGNTLRWNFVVTQHSSGYTLRSGEEEAVVGYHGSFWVDSKSLDLVRLEIFADDLPPRLGMKSAGDAVEYHRVQLGDEAYLLPSKSEMLLVSGDGFENRNRTAFSGCRQYTGESTITFDDPAPLPVTTEAARRLNVASGLSLEVVLETPVSQTDSAVGDPVTAILKKPVKLGSGLVAPKGALLHGRITLLRRQQSREPGWIVGLTFFEMEWQNTRGRLQAKLERAPTLSMLTMSSARTSALVDGMLEQGLFFLPGRLSMHRGFLMVWRTEPLPAEDKQ
jgi:hypothetical protein